MHAAAKEISGGAYLSGIHIGLREHAAAQEHGDFVGVDLIVLGLTPMNGFHVEGVAQDEGNPFLGAQVGEPVPSEDTFDADNQVFAVGCNSFQKRFRPCLHIPVAQDGSILVQDAKVHGTGVQVDATIKFVLLGVESHEVSSSSVGCFPNASIPRWYAEEGASISINTVERTRHKAARRSAGAFGTKNTMALQENLPNKE
jgi:hypothetical protein